LAYPSIYNVTYSYTGFQQAQQGISAFPGTQIDADFAGLYGSVSSLALFVTGVLRSDGALNNGVVTYDSLAPSLQTAGLAPASAWATAKSYLFGNAVTINSNLYRCLVAHTSGVFATDLAAGKWVLVASLIAGPPGTNGTNGTNGIQGVQGPPGSNAPIFSFEGDSLTFTPGFGTWPLKLPAMSGFFSRGVSYQFALAGDTAALMVGEYAAQAGSIAIPAGQEAYFFLWAGTNDVASGQISVAVTGYNYLKTLWAAARASGYKVIAFTLMLRSDLTPTTNAVRVDLNTLILSDPTLYDGLVRPDIMFTDTGDLSTFRDGVHLTEAANVLVAKAVIAATLGTPSIPASPLSWNNIAINGSMEVSQENGASGITTASGGYVVDGCKLLYSGTMGVQAQQWPAGPPGFPNSVAISVTTAETPLAAGDYAALSFPIEGWRVAHLGFGTSNAQTLSIAFRSQISFAGLYSVILRNAAKNRTYVATFVQATSASQYNRITIPGDFLGVWNSTFGVGFEVLFVAAAGASLLGTPGVWTASALMGATGQANDLAGIGAGFLITGLFIIAGVEVPSAAQLPAVMRPYAEELHLCQRYFCSDFPEGVIPANNVQKHTDVAISYSANLWAAARTRFPRSMRPGAIVVTPYSASGTIGPPTAGQWQYLTAAGAWANGTTTLAGAIDIDGFQMQGASVMTANGGWIVAGSWKADSRL
jgi:hypothetical protein